MKRMYTLYQRVRGTRKWTRVELGGVPAPAFPKETAVRVYQNALLASALGDVAWERKLDVV